MRCCNGRERWNPSLRMWPFLDKEQGKSSRWRITQRDTRVNGDSGWRQAREMRHHLEDGGGWWNWSDDEDDLILLMGSSAETGITGIFLRADSAEVDKKTKIWGLTEQWIQKEPSAGWSRREPWSKRAKCLWLASLLPPSPWTQVNLNWKQQITSTMPPLRVPTRK